MRALLARSVPGRDDADAPGRRARPRRDGADTWRCCRLGRRRPRHVRLARREPGARRGREARGGGDGGRGRRRTLPVLAGVAETSTPAACRYVEDCTRLGADGFMVMPAMVYRGDDREILSHFRSVAAATDRPLMIYNNPVSYGNDVTPDDVRKARDDRHDRGDQGELGGHAPDHGHPERGRRPIRDLRRRRRPRARERRRSASTAGSRAPASLSLREPVPLGPDAAGRVEEGPGRLRWYMPLLHLDTHPKLVQYIKLALQENGLGAEWVRAPRLPLVGTERARVLRVIREGIATRPKLPATHRRRTRVAAGRG